MDAVGERKITYDARGLVEPDAEVPNVSEIDGDRAVFDAHPLTTRQINLELKSLLYERGIKNVTVRNPGAKHSLGVGILTRCKITFEGSLGYFGCGVIDGPEVHITGRVGWSACENMMSGVVVVEGNAGSLTAAALRGGDVVVKARSAPAPGSTRRVGRSSPWARPVAQLLAGGHQRHPREVGAGPLPDARVLDVQADPALGRADVPARDADPLRDRGLPREVRDEDGAGRPLRQEADRAGHPGV